MQVQGLCFLKYIIEYKCNAILLNREDNDQMIYEFTGSAIQAITVDWQLQ